MRIDVRTNAVLIRAQVELDSKELRTATRDSLNRAADRTKTRASSLLRETYEIKKKDLDKAFHVRRATRDTLVAIVGARGYPLPVYDFKPRPGDVVRPQPGLGVSVSVKKGSRAVLKGSFVARMKSGHIGVFVRRSSHYMKRVGPRGGRVKAIKERFVPSVPGMLGFKEVDAAIRVSAVAFFETAMDQNIRRFGSRRG